MEHDYTWPEATSLLFWFYILIFFSSVVLYVRGISSYNEIRKFLWRSFLGNIIFAVFMVLNPRDHYFKTDFIFFCKFNFIIVFTAVVCLRIAGIEEFEDLHAVSYPWPLEAILISICLVLLPGVPLLIGYNSEVFREIFLALFIYYIKMIYNGIKMIRSMFYGIFIDWYWHARGKEILFPSNERRYNYLRKNLLKHVEGSERYVYTPMSKMSRWNQFRIRFVYTWIHYNDVYTYYKEFIYALYMEWFGIPTMNFLVVFCLWVVPVWATSFTLYTVYWVVFFRYYHFEVPEYW